MVEGRPARIVLGVGGGIAAYKVATLLRGLVELDHEVQVVPTTAALEFVGVATWSALSGRPVRTDVWSDVHEVPHVRLGQRADLVIVAPATADLLARAAHGLADDLLTTTLLTARCPVVMAPAMHTEMWEHPATQANVTTLRARGVLVLEPASGRLTGADSGSGRLPEPADLLGVVRSVLSAGALPTDLRDRRVVVSAGGTREALDPVRYLGNRSSGRQGWALATAAMVRGADVTLVSGPVEIGDPAGMEVVHVESAHQLQRAVRKAAADADAVVMAAAVADFRPATESTTKIKKAGSSTASLELVQNPDILVELAGPERVAGQVVVGFAAETGDDHGDVLAHGRAKLAAKGCDLLVVNEVGPDRGFSSPDNAAVILGADGAEVEVPYGPKEALAHRVWDLVVARL